MKRFFNVLMLVCAAFVTMNVMAQTAPEVKPKPKKFHGNPDYYLEVQGAHIFRNADVALDENPPMVNATAARKAALYCLDALHHDVRYDNSEAMREFCNSRINKLVADLEKPVKKGLKIYKVYNEGMVARTKSVTVAFDLVRGTYLARRQHAGTDYRIVTDEQMKAIVDKCDVMFLSHNHTDHIDRWVVEQFIAAGKPVIANPEILANVDGVDHWRDDEGIFSNELMLKNGEKLQVKIFPGHQKPIRNNVPVITTPEKYTICHTGDQHDSKSSSAWIETVKDNAPKIDALMINCWTNSILKALKGFNPRYVITAHENEMGHSIDHREAFWLTFDKLKTTEYPFVVMSWGEWFTIK